MSDASPHAWLRFWMLTAVALLGTGAAGWVILEQLTLEAPKPLISTESALRPPQTQTVEPAARSVAEATSSPASAFKPSEETVRVATTSGSEPRAAHQRPSFAAVDDLARTLTRRETPDASPAPVANQIPTETAVDDLPAAIERLPSREGRRLFLHEWTPRDSLSQGDGLGPVYNATSCVACHFEGGVGGSGPVEKNVHVFEILPTAKGKPVHEGVVHAFAPEGEGERTGIEAKLKSVFGLSGEKIEFGTYVGPANRRSWFSMMKIDPIRRVTINTPALWGNGEIDRLTDAQLEKASRTGRLRKLSQGRSGKFGWKGQFASLEDFVAAACANEIGLSNPIAKQQAPGKFAADREAADDLTRRQVDALVRYVASLPRPRQVLPAAEVDLRKVRRGTHLFTSIGCASCHTANVGKLEGVYSDFRLHEIASAQGGDLYYPPNESAEPRYPPPPDYPNLTEWKTPPLWGVASTAPYWHDGSAPTLEKAIAKHFLDGKRSRQNFERLGADDQAALLAFLNTLQGPEGTEPAPNRSGPIARTVENRQMARANP